MLRDLLRNRIEAAVARLVARGELPPQGYEVEVLDPKLPEHGDYSCNFALVYAKLAKASPRELALKLAAELEAEDREGPSDAVGEPLLRSGELIERLEVAGPGFLNFRLRPSAIAAMVPEILAKGEGLLQPPQGAVPNPMRLNVEFVSVNPNGPITVGSGRGAAFGSTLCNVLEAAGHKVHREYYINDGTNSEQMRLFAESVRSYVEGRPLPEGGYRGEYVEQVASTIASELREIPENVSEELRSRSERLMIAMQRQDLAAFSTTFHTWFSEQSLHDTGRVEECIQELIAKGAADDEPYQLEIVKRRGGEIEVVRHDQPLEEEGDEPLPTGAPAGIQRAAGADSPTPPSGNTLWLRSTKFADDKDRVLRRKDGRWTYIASDVAYHKSKFERGSPPREGQPIEPADKLITILGPDHHGYIGRLRAVVAALLEQTSDVGPSRPTYPLSDTDASIYRTPEERDACLAALEAAIQRLEVIIFQIVRFVKDGKPAPMRKRDGNVYSLRDLMFEIGKNAAPTADEDEQLRIGKDVARFFYLMRSHDTHMDFDLDLAEKQSEDNPVYYVQYAHARICSILRRAADELESEGAESHDRPFDPELLDHPKELSLVKKICDLSHEVRRCAEDYGVHRLTAYAIDLARAFHAFYDSCRVIQPENPRLTRARLALCEAARIGLKCTFDLMGISAPERMERADTT